jgi:parvulin-like peptidyl-prolyl isomerase
MTRRALEALSPVRAILLIGALVATAAVVRAQVVEQILVKVNGEVMSTSDLENRQLLAVRQRGQTFDPKAPVTDRQLRTLLDEIMPQLMVDAVNEMVVVQRGRELGYALSDDQFKSAVDSIRKENKLDTEELFQAALKQENLTLADLRKNLERQMIFQRVQQTEVLGRIAITDEEARRYYDTHLSEFTTPASVTIRQIVISVPAGEQGVNAAQDMAAREKADKARERIVAGESFEQVLAEVSDPPAQINGGLVGPLSLSDMPQSLAAIIEPLRIGESTAVVRTTAGYQIFKLEASSPTDVMPFEQARQRISDRVFTDKRRAEFLKYLEKLRGQAIIEWKNEDVKKAYEEGLRQQSAGDNQQPAVSSR